MAKLCMGCMNPLPEGNTTCAVCGFDPAVDKNPEHCLPITAALQGHYIVGRLMSAAGDHLLYLAYDRQLREPCFIQEFFPAGVCRRDTIGGVQPLEGCGRIFEEYAAQFRGMVRTLARMRELPAVVPVYDIFEENGTVYAVSDYCQGMTLTKKTKLSGGRIAWPEARTMFMSLTSSLAALNDAGVYHLAICPDNILVGADGKARLRGFSIPAARRMGTDLNPDLCTGYAAPEQYSTLAEVDASADVYGMAATLFRTVTGNEPPAGNTRAKDSDDLFMSAEVAEELTQPVCVALFNALQVQAGNRTATVTALREQLALTPTVSALVDEVAEDMERTNAARSKEAKSGMSAGKLLLLFGGCLLGLALVAVVVLAALGLLDGGHSEPDTSNTIPSVTTTTIATSPTLANGKVAVDNLVGLNYYDLRTATLSGNVKVVVDHLEFSDKVAGTVLSQEPAARTEVDTGSEVRVVISYGQKDENMTIPDVSGWKQEHARLYLEALGFRVRMVTLQDSTVDKGLVQDTHPQQGAQARLGDVIDLRVSDKETTTTPSASQSKQNADNSKDESDTSKDDNKNNGNNSNNNNNNDNGGDDNSKDESDSTGTTTKKNDTTTKKGETTTTTKKNGN